MLYSWSKILYTNLLDLHFFQKFTITFIISFHKSHIYLKFNYKLEV
uniref:Uncharacterized protein n=1 Tax=Manihot esculenta TaxID=3983 RepID=A0A2C9VQ85_MANES